MSVSPHKDLIAEVENYLGRTGMNPSDFGRRAVNDPNLVGDLQRGRELRSSTVERVRRFLSRQHPPPRKTKSYYQKVGVMSTRPAQDTTTGPIILWQASGRKWQPCSFDTLQEALGAAQEGGRPFVITRVVRYEVKEVA